MDFHEILLVPELKCTSYGSRACGKGLLAPSINKNTSPFIREVDTISKFYSNKKFYWIFVRNWILHKKLLVFLLRIQKLPRIFFAISLPTHQSFFFSNNHIFNTNWFAFKCIFLNGIWNTRSRDCIPQHMQVKSFFFWQQQYFRVHDRV